MKRVTVLIAFLLVLSGCTGGGGKEVNGTEKRSSSPSRNVNGTQEVETRLENRTVLLERVEKPKNTSAEDLVVINGSQLPPQERGMLSRTVHGDMRIEPLYGKHRLKDVFMPLRNRFFRHLGTNSSKLYIEIEGEFYRITVGGIWEGGPTIDADDPPGVIVIIPNGNLSRSSTTNLSVKILRRNQTVHTESYVSVGYSERVYETKKPGNYIVEISWNGESVTETFNISFDTLADCNSDKYRITFGQNSPEIDVSSTAEGCTDPADVSSNG